MTMKKAKRILVLLAVLALLAVLGLTALAAGPSVGGAPLCPKGGKNLIDLTKITGDTGDYLYTKDQLISEGGNEDKTVEFAVDASGITELAPYVVSMWVKVDKDTEDWIGFEVTTNDNGKVSQSVKVCPNVIYLRENGKEQAQCTNIKIPKGSYFKFDIYFRPDDSGRYYRNIFVNNQPVTNDWGGASADMPLDAVKPVLRFTSVSGQFEISSLRMYLVDANAKSFEPVTTPIKRTDAPVNTTAPTKAPNTSAPTKAPNTTAKNTSGSQPTSSAPDSSEPDGSDPVSAPSDVATTAPTTTRAAAAQPSGGVNVWMIVIVIVAVVLAGGGVAIALILRSPGQTPEKTADKTENDGRDE